MIRRPAVLIAALAAVAALAAPRARAAPPSEPRTEGPRADVAVLRPASDDPVLVAASARIGLELGVNGATSALVERADGFPARVALVREDGVVTIDVLGTPAAGAPLHRRVRVPRSDGGDDPAVIAVRAAELLRGIRLEVRRPPVEAARAADTEPGGEAAAATSEAGPAMWRFEAGLGVLSARPFGAALGVGPTLAAAGLIVSHVSFTATFAGPFSTDRPPTPEGSAHTREELVAIGLRADTFRARINAHALATVGLHHVRATYDGRGIPEGPNPVLHFVTPQSVWNPTITIAAGASMRLSQRIGVSLQLAAVFVEPALEIVANGRGLGTLGGPSLLPTLSAWTAL